MATVAFQQAEIDQELVQLTKVSPSLNALSQKDREKVMIRLFALPLNVQLKVKDMLLREQEDLAKATPEDMHAHYMQLKEMYASLKAEKASLEGRLREVRENKSRKEDLETIEILEQELDDPNLT